MAETSDRKSSRSDSTSSDSSSSSAGAGAAAPQPAGLGGRDRLPEDSESTSSSESEEEEEEEGRQSHDRAGGREPSPAPQQGSLVTEDEEGERSAGKRKRATSSPIPPAKKPRFSPSEKREERGVVPSLSIHYSDEEGERSAGKMKRAASSPSPPAKKPRFSSPEKREERGVAPSLGTHYSDISRRMMESMGYRPGQGLGRFGEGITVPITESTQLGRRGLGFTDDAGLEREDIKWDEEPVNIHQEVEWLVCSSQPLPDEDELFSWLVEGERKETIAEETLFVDSDILAGILRGKSVFDTLSEKEFLNARQRSNPYETIKGVFFQNRAAMKMANIDAVTGFMFTDPRDENRAPLGPLEVLYFADICAGPGGFSEYVLWRRKWHAKGFGFTLKNPDSGSDFKLDSFSSPCETFDPHYGVNGYEGDGDITNPDNQSAFRDYVIDNTEGRGVHFVMADGGISVEGQENIQELLLKQLVICQYATALATLRPGGCCVVKVFDMFTQFSVGLFYLLYRCFHRISLFKPATSRPANSERYVICQGLREGADTIANYMYGVNEELCRLSGTPHDIVEVVPLSLMQNDEAFFTYIRAFNDSFGDHQIIHLQKLKHFVKNTSLQDRRQTEIRRKCLQLWKVPDNPRVSSSSLETANQVFKSHWQRLYSSVKPGSQEAEERMKADMSLLKAENFTPVTRQGLDFLRCLHSWKWCWAAGKRMMVVGLGRNQVRGWEMREDQPKFMPQKILSELELPRGTILEVEYAQEYEGTSGQRKHDVIYILDVLAIYDEFLGCKPPKERLQYAEKLAKVLNKPCRRIPLLRAKTHHRVADLSSEETFPRLEMRECKGKGRGKFPTAEVSGVPSRYLAPVGIMFFKYIRDPWELYAGKKGLYFNNHITKISQYECPHDSVASFLHVLRSRHFWRWEKATAQGLCGVLGEEEDDSNNSPDILTRKALCNALTHFRTS